MSVEGISSTINGPETTDIVEEDSHIEAPSSYCCIDEIDMLIEEGFIDLPIIPEFAGKETEQGYSCSPCAQDKSGLEGVPVLSCKLGEVGSEILVNAEEPSEEILEDGQDSDGHPNQEGTGPPVGPERDEDINLTLQDTCRELHSDDQDQVKETLFTTCCPEHQMESEETIDYGNLFCADCDFDKDGVWSILTDELRYVQNPYEDKEIRVLPCIGDRLKRWKHKNLSCPNKWNNPLTWANQMPDKYCGVKSTISAELDPHNDITTTYLWSDPFATEAPSGEWFEKACVRINQNMAVKGELEDGTPVHTLLDSGASKTMMNSTFYQNHPLLRSMPIYKMAKQKIRIANNQVITTDQAIKVPISYQGHVIEFIAYIIPFAPEFDFIIGVKSMVELEAQINFQKLEWSFYKRSIGLQVDKDYLIPPGKSTYVEARMLQKPNDLHDGEAILKWNKDINKLISPASTVKAHLKDGKILIKVTNQDTEPLSYPKRAKIGVVDLRSLGYCHLSRETIQRLLSRSFKFLNETGEEENLNSFLDMPIHREKTPNTKLKMRQETSKVFPDLWKTKEETKSKREDPETKDPYPWLDPEDPRRQMTDLEIFQNYVDLSDSALSTKQKDAFLKVLMKHREAFSLRDEIGTCPNIEIKLELNDKTPFFIRPFPISEKDKELVDKQMKKGVLLGILKKGLSSYSSPIMLIPRKLGGIPRIVTDFRHLNSRLIRLNCTFPLVRDAIQLLGTSKCEVISVVDLRDAYHTLRLSKESQQYCGITPYYGSDTYIYQRLGMGLSVSPAIWQTFINKVLDSIEERKHHLAIMDDCLVHSDFKTHITHLKALFQALITNGLKISPKKCQFYKQSLTYMGQTLMIKEKTPFITPMKNRLEAIVKLAPPTTVKGCRSFCGMVNYLSMYLPHLQKRLIPIYHLTRKGVPFFWTEECQLAFEDVKKDLVNPPVLVMPNARDPFLLVSDTSIEAAGAALYQCQKKVWRLVGYNSKKLPEPARNYSISELELFGLAVNVHSFKHLLKNREFTVVIDHSALTYILNSKKEPPTLRLRKLIEILSEYSFKVKFMKGKDMHVSDFLSRHPDADNSPANEIIPISFQMKEILTNTKRLSMIQHMLGFPDVLNVFLDLVYPEKCPLRRQSPTPEESCYRMTEEVPQDSLHVTTRAQAAKAATPVKPIWPMTGETKKPGQSPAPPKPAPRTTPSTPYTPLRTRSSSPSLPMTVPGLVTPPSTSSSKPPITPRRKRKPLEEKEDKEVRRILDFGDETVQPIPPEPSYEPPPQPLPYPQPLPLPWGLPPAPVVAPEAPIPPQSPEKQELPEIVEEMLRRSSTPLPKAPETEGEVPTTTPPADPMPRGPAPTIDIRFTGNLTPEYPDDDDPEHDMFQVRKPEEFMYREPSKLFDEISDRDILRKHIPKQKELDKFLHKLKSRVLHDYEIPFSIKELAAEYPKSPFYRDIYNYIQKGFISSEIRGKAVRQLKAQSEDYVIIDGVLFRFMYPKDMTQYPIPKLVIPERLIPHILYQYHDTSMAGHQGVLRTYYTIKDKYYIHDLLPITRRYVRACHDCQVRKGGPKYPKAFFKRIPCNYNPMTCISADLKWMPKSSYGMQYILVSTCEITSYVIGIAIRDGKSLTIADALLNRICFTFGSPKTLIIDADRALSSNVMTLIYERLKIRTKIISPGNHGSLKTERQIQTIGDNLSKILHGTGRDWPKYINAACYAANSFVNPRLGYCPFELLFGQKPRPLTEFSFDPLGDLPVGQDVKDFMTVLKKKFEIMKQVIMAKRLMEQETQFERQRRVVPEEPVYRVGDLVYLFAPGYGSLVMPSRKIKQDYIGPLKIQAILDKTHYILADLEGKLVPFLTSSVHPRLLKPCYLAQGVPPQMVQANEENSKGMDHALRPFEPP